MKSLLVLAVLVSGSAYSAVRYMNDIYKQAEPEDLKEVQTLQKQMAKLPLSYTNEQVFEVTKVEKGSIYERTGIKVGDYIVNGSSPETTPIKVTPTTTTTR